MKRRRRKKVERKSRVKTGITRKEWKLGREWKRKDEGRKMMMKKLLDVEVAERLGVKR